MRRMPVLNEKRKIPKFPNHKDYAYRCRRFFEASSILSFMSIANFRVMKEAINGYRYKCAIPRDILIDPTNACNMSCRGCWAGEYGNTSNLSYEKLDDILAQAKKLGTMDILMTGGEPLLRKKDIIKLASKYRKLFFGIFTNATLIDDDFVKDMVRLQNISVFISIEGFREDTDFRRGEGSFDKAAASMKLLKENDISFAFSLCYHKKNYVSVTSDEFLDYLREQGAWYGWAFGYRPIGKNADMSLCLNAEERAYVRNRFNEYCSENDFTIIDLFNSGHKAYGCVGAGSGYVHINSNGDVEPCAFCHYSDSNINEMTLIKALQSPFFRAFRNAQPFSKNSLKPCPMVDVPEALVEVANMTGARSTHSQSPETPEAFYYKISDIADEWSEKAAEEYDKVSAEERRRFRFLIGYLKLKKRLSGDTKMLDSYKIK